MLAGTSSTLRVVINMPYIRVDPQSNLIQGRVREKVDKYCIEVSDELFGRIISEPSAFQYYPETGQIDLAEDYDTAPSEHDPVALAQFASEIDQNFLVPELGVEVSIAGPFGRHLLFALACAKYCPQTIVCNTKGLISTITIDEAAATAIANALRDKSSLILNTLGVSDEPAD